MDRGQVSPLVAGVMVVAAVVTLGLVRLGVVLVDRAAAQAAADAAALAGVEAGEATSRQVAAANGAELVSYRALPGQVQVEVIRGRARAVATAVVGPPRRPAPVADPEAAGHVP